jgi:hypothetical protein
MTKSIIIPHQTDPATLQGENTRLGDHGVRNINKLHTILVELQEILNTVVYV